MPAFLVPLCLHASVLNVLNNYKFWRRFSPLLASPQGGVDAASRKMSRSHRIAADGVVYLFVLDFVLDRKTTPAALLADALRYFSCSRGHPSLR